MPLVNPCINASIIVLISGLFKPSWYVLLQYFSPYELAQFNTITDCFHFAINALWHYIINDLQT